MQNLANYTQMLYQSPSEPTYFSAYQPYGGTTANGGAATCMCTTATCTVNTIINTETTLAKTASLASDYTGLGIAYYNSMVSPPDTVTPSIPTNLAGSAVSTNANLSWTASTDNIGVAGYNIIRNGVWVANSEATTYTDSGLATSTTYNYQVQAFDLAGNTSLSSATVAVSTVYTIPPTAPTNVVATPYSAVGITLTWTASQDPKGLSSYQIFRGTSPSSLLQVGTVDGTTTSYKDNSLTASTTYYYGVEATEASYVSTMSAIASATTLALPSAPTNLVATPVSGQQIGLTWTASTGGLPISSYHILPGYLAQRPESDRRHNGHIVHGQDRDSLDNLLLRGAGKRHGRKHFADVRRGFGNHATGTQHAHEPGGERNLRHEDQPELDRDRSAQRPADRELPGLLRSGARQLEQGCHGAEYSL